MVAPALKGPRRVHRPGRETGAYENSSEAASDSIRAAVRQRLSLMLEAAEKGVSETRPQKLILHTHENGGIWYVRDVTDIRA